MSPANLKDVMRGAVLALFLVSIPAAALAADEGETLRIPVGHSVVVPSGEDVNTVAIAEPDIADAAVGSARTVIVTAKKAGATSLVVYNEGGRYRVYEVIAYVPNGDQQVLLHCTVAEMSAAAIHELGFDLIAGGHSNTPRLDGWLGGGLYGAKVTSEVDPFSNGSFVFEEGTDVVMSYLKNDGNLALKAAIEALEEKGDIRLLASPTLLAKSGEKATFLSGGEFAYQVVTGSGLGATASVQFKEFGVRLEFTPTVQSNGAILLKVAPEVSEPDYTRSINGIPPLNSRKTSTTVMLRGGEYLVVGGLKDTRSNKIVRRIPLLGRLPLLGFLFTYQRKETSAKELVVLVSPEIVEPTTAPPFLPTDKADATR